ncbi:hypothetical protein BD626DRAFT_23773 [Schizophyllum amplum]|uniref:Uncharacterized protein n=1 Tax=Schizophyllum amplum TaxID=97359 RepID=A0A550CZ96_9AGAR|nr:hypothetical protein BD626DRAFT_23773 [Auriculariopsis ampla]
MMEDGSHGGASHNSPRCLPSKHTSMGSAYSFPRPRTINYLFNCGTGPGSPSTVHDHTHLFPRTRQLFSRGEACEIITHHLHPQTRSRPARCCGQRAWTSHTKLQVSSGRAASTRRCAELQHPHEKPSAAAIRDFPGYEGCTRARRSMPRGCGSPESFELRISPRLHTTCSTARCVCERRKTMGPLDSSRQLIQTPVAGLGPRNKHRLVSSSSE